MSLAEELYDDSDDVYPPVWLDVLFITTIVTIHSWHALKFSWFSLGYLYAKCKEHQDVQPWTESLRFVEARYSLREKEHVDFKQKQIEKVTSALWAQLSIFHTFMSAFMFASCWISLVFIVILWYITFLNSIAECINNGWSIHVSGSTCAMSTW